MLQLTYTIAGWYWTPWLLAISGWLIVIGVLVKYAWTARKKANDERYRLGRAVQQVRHLLDEKRFSSTEVPIAQQLTVLGRCLNSTWLEWLWFRCSGVPSTRRRIEHLYQLLTTAEEAEPTYSDGFRFRKIREYSIERRFVTRWLGVISRHQVWQMLDDVNAWPSGRQLGQSLAASALD